MLCGKGVDNVSTKIPNFLQNIQGEFQVATAGGATWKTIHFCRRYAEPAASDRRGENKGSKWRLRRKMITPAFHFRILDNFVEIFAENAETLVEKLKERADGRAFDIFPPIALCSLDIICESAMGTSVNAQKQTQSEYIDAVSRISELTAKRIITPWLYPDFIFKRSPTGKEYYSLLNILHGFTKKVIRDRKQARKVNGDQVSASVEDNTGRRRRVAFLDMLLDASEHGQQLTDQDLQDEVDTFMFEGHDTTSLATSWVLVLLGHHPDVQEKAFVEQNDIFRNDPRRRLTTTDLNDMRYLDMVIREALRLYPSVCFISRQLTKQVEVGGYTVPEGCMVTLNLRQTHNDPNHWPEPERFNPDNFLPDRAKGRHPYAYVPFSAGPRNCIGQKFAMLEMKAVVSHVLRTFCVETVDSLEDLRLTGELMLRPLNGVNVRLSPR